jgi:hypothetical protein
VATFDEYAKAVIFVENLIENDFPAGAIAIVGKNLRTVERVRIKISQWRIALSGAITGSWVGLLFAMFSPVADSASGASVGGLSVSTAAAPVLIGAGIGTLFNVVRFSLARNKRSFSSQSMVVASEYQVQVPNDLVSQANEASAKGSTAS